MKLSALKCTLTQGWRWLVSGVSLLVAQHGALAQNDVLETAAISPGGGISSGGNYRLYGGINSAATGVMQADHVILIGGFWCEGDIFRELEMPLLAIEQSQGAVTISWHSTLPGLSLEECPSLESPVWAPVAQKPTFNGDTVQVTMPVTGGHKFYRLRRLLLGA